MVSMGMFITSRSTNCHEKYAGLGDQKSDLVLDNEDLKMERTSS